MHGLSDSRTARPSNARLSRGWTELNGATATALRSVLLSFALLACGESGDANSTEATAQPTGTSSSDVPEDNDGGSPPIGPSEEDTAGTASSTPNAGGAAPVNSEPTGGGETSVGGAGGTPEPSVGGAGSPAVGGESNGGNGGSEASAGNASNTDAGPPNNGGSAGAEPQAPDCSETELRTGPPPGKEMFRTDPIDEVFPFSQHYMGTFSDDPRYVSMTSFSDIDNDGDLDFATGQRQDLGGGMAWWEYCTPDHWVRHYVGTGHTSAAGGNALDVDADGWVDLLAGNSWYKNPTNPRESEWQRFDVGAPGAEELIVGDVTGDQRGDVLWVWRSIDPVVMTPGADPQALWEEVVAFEYRQQQGGAIGDIDGDGDNDILVGNEWWYRNVNGDGSEWENVNIEAGADFDEEPLTHLGDLDGDGDIDLVMATHFGNRVAWLQNQDASGGGDGAEFTLNIIATDKEFLHAVVAADYDNDGDVDIFAGQNVGPSFIFANDGAGNFTEHTIVENSRAHEARVGDVDCDGDLDIAGKPWGDPNEGGEVDLTTRDHVYFRNMLVEQGGTAQFERTPGEVWHDIQPRSSCR